MKTYRKALTIAGSDSGGGAGIQADLKTFGALGCYGMSVITAITAQNTVEVSAIHPIPIAIIKAQLEEIFTDMGSDSVKIGMLHSSEIINLIAQTLQDYKIKNIVLDTVMISKSGNALLQEEAIAELKNTLIPIADIITPNIPEAEVLLQREIKTILDMRLAVKQLSKLGSKSILLKGGHFENVESVDLFYRKGDNEILELPFTKIETKNTHGTGCTLSSAIAANLALGFSLKEAVIHAKDYITSAINAGKNYALGKGHGPVHHFFNHWE